MAKKKTTKSKTVVRPMVFTSPPTPIGVDASWTGLAVTALELIREGDTTDIEGVAFKRGPTGLRVRMSEVLSTKPGDFPSQSARLHELGWMFTETINKARVGESGGFPKGTPPSCLVAIEGYAMGSKTRPQMAGELGGHLRLLLWQAGIPYIIVPPTLVKKFTTGKGTSPKEVMMMEVFKRWGYESPCNNSCDAYALSRIAAEFAAGGWTKKFEGIAQGFECVGVKA